MSPESYLTVTCKSPRLPVCLMNTMPAKPPNSIYIYIYTSISLVFVVGQVDVRELLYSSRLAGRSLRIHALASLIDIFVFHSDNT